MVKGVFAKATKTKNPNKIKTIDAMRLKKYVGCYISQNRNGCFKKFVRNARAPVEHLFDDHSFCDSTWCWSKEIEQTVDEIMKKVRRKGKLSLFTKS